MKKLFDDIKSARWAIILIIAYFAFFQKKIYTICPSVILTGFPCPGCGMTRALLRIVHFDFVGAWEMHPFIYPVAVLALSFCICRYVLDGKYMNYLKIFMIVIACSMLLFYIYRMITMYPDIEPMIYYENNYLKRLINIITLISN